MINFALLNIALLYPEKHCDECKAMACDGCRLPGFECANDTRKMLRIAQAEKVDTVIRVFLCRPCRTNPETTQRIAKRLKDITENIDL